MQSFEGREMVQNFFSVIFLLAGHRAIARHCNDFVSVSTNGGIVEGVALQQCVRSNCGVQDGLSVITPLGCISGAFNI